MQDTYTERKTYELIDCLFRIVACALVPSIWKVSLVPGRMCRDALEHSALSAVPRDQTLLAVSPRSEGQIDTYI
jgi:hypothetical protein